ncbi:putative holin-like toxin [Bombilactobacillus mellifer]|nr:putative holin-like toxin [Bombilactobacillus mellifer]
MSIKDTLMLMLMFGNLIIALIALMLDNKK